MEICPRCSTPSVPAEDNHFECPACGFFFNPAVFHHFVVKPSDDSDEGDILAEYSMG